MADVPLFSQPNGDKWNKQAWRNALIEALKLAQLPDDDIVLYTIRHTVISEMVSGGMDVFTVAKITGTSSKMIDKHYGHLLPNKTRTILDNINILASTTRLK